MRHYRSLSGVVACGLGLLAVAGCTGGPVRHAAAVDRRATVVTAAPEPAPTVTTTVTATPSAAPTPTASATPKPKPKPVVWPRCTANQLGIFLVSDRTHYTVKQPVVFKAIMFNQSAKDCDVAGYGGVTVEDGHHHVVWPSGPSGAGTAIPHPELVRVHMAAHAFRTWNETWSQCTCGGVFATGAYPDESERAAPGAYYAYATVTLRYAGDTQVLDYSQRLSFTLDSDS